MTSLYRKCKRELKRMDPNFGPSDEGFMHAMLMLGALSVGPSIVRLSKAMGIPRATIRPISKALRANGIWVRGMTRARWFDSKTGGIAFWCDVLAAQGLLNRVPAQEEGP